MAKQKSTDDRKQLLIRYRMDKANKVNFIDPCCDEMPAILFFKMMEALASVEKAWNEGINDKI